MAGKVYLVGSGPGTIGLLSQRAAAVIANAETVLYDQLPGEEILASLPAGAERIDCGKFGGDHIKEQVEIERLIIEHARAGRTVVRLKGGDPFMFGRGGEELEAVREAGIEVEVVPGISSALAVPASVGIPLTHRRYTSQVTVVTGHEDPAKDDTAINWAGLAPGSGTIVVLMGVRNLSRIAEVLISNGRDPATPVAVIERGFRRDQRVTIGRLDAIGALAAEKSVRPPAVIVIGGVVELYDPASPVLTPAEGTTNLL
ncbi:MAG: uroporphyrinogen-III C-methyltransferase [Methanospirillum sp.]